MKVRFIAILASVGPQSLSTSFIMTYIIATITSNGDCSRVDDVTLPGYGAIVKVGIGPSVCRHGDGEYAKEIQKETSLYLRATASV